MAFYEIDFQGTFVDPTDPLAEFLLGSGAGAIALNNRKLVEFCVIKDQYRAFHKRLEDAQGGLVTDSLLIRLPGGTARCHVASQWTNTPAERYYGLIAPDLGGAVVPSWTHVASAEAVGKRIATGVVAAHVGGRRTSVRAGTSMLEFVVPREAPWVDAETWARVLMLSLKKWLAVREKMQPQRRYGQSHDTTVDTDAQIAALKLYEDTARLEFSERAIAATLAERNGFGAAAFYRYDSLSGTFLLRVEHGLPEGVHLPRRSLPNMDDGVRIVRGQHLEDWPYHWGERQPESEIVAFILDEGRPLGFLWMPSAEASDDDEAWLLAFCAFLPLVLLDVEHSATEGATARALDLAIRHLVRGDPALFHDAFLRLAIEEVCVEGASLFIAQRRYGEVSLLLAATSGIKGVAHSSWNEVIYRLGEGLTGKLAKENAEIVRFLDVVEERGRLGLGEPRYVELTSHGIASFLGCPIFDRENGIVGYLRLCNRSLGSGPTSHFSGQDEAIIKALTRVAGQFFDLRERQRQHEDALDRSMHELTAPLVAIRAGASRVGSLIDRRRFDYVRNIAEDIHTDSELLLDLVDTIYISSGNVKVKREPTELTKHIILPLYRNLHQFARRKGFQDFYVDFSAMRHLPAIDVDRTMMRQVFYNFLVNAIKYSDPSTHSLRIELSGRVLRDGKITIAVRDWGIGVQFEDRERIFHQYFRGSEAIRREPTGSGIGLSIVKRVLEMHDGTVSLSNLKQPTEFTLTLPQGKKS